MTGCSLLANQRRPALIAAILPLLLLVFLAGVRAKPQDIKPGCRYEGKRYAEGDFVGTSEPCLQCRCTDGSLRCRLRVCPKLPDPMPLGCRSKPPPPNEHVCCAKIVCDGVGAAAAAVPEKSESSENLLQRSKTTALEAEPPGKGEGCVYEGVRYGPGSAMMGSRRCEYCYCISGARKCIQPKCLLPLPGCVPLYNPHSCCPVAYNCTRQAEFSTTLAAISAFGCRKGQRIYQEGEMVRDIPWKAACDNCFCAMGAIRCVPLACAPPLQGCQPIVRQGQCCPSTYNCSGTIEVKAEQNFASYAFISKDYAKFRKENHYYPAIHDLSLTSIEGRGYRVVNEILPPSLLASGRSNSDSATEKFSLASTITTSSESIISDEDVHRGESNADEDDSADEHDNDDDDEAGAGSETETMNNEIIGETTDYPKSAIHTAEQEQQQSTTGKLELSSEITLDQSVTTTAAAAAVAAPLTTDNDSESDGEPSGDQILYTTSNYLDAELNNNSPETTLMTAAVSTTTTKTTTTTFGQDTSVASIVSLEKSGGGDIISISMQSSENCSSHGQDEFETTSSVGLNATDVTTTTTTTTLMPLTSSTTTTTTTKTTTKKPPKSTTMRVKLSNAGAKKNSTSSSVRPTKKNNNSRPSKSTQKPHTKKNTTKRLTASSKIAMKNNSKDDKNNNIVAQMVEKSSITCTNGTSDETTTEGTAETSPISSSTPITSTSTTTSTTTTTTTTTTSTTTESPETTLAFNEEAERTTIDQIIVDNEPIMEREKLDGNDDDDEEEKTISMISVKNPSSGLSTSILVPNDMLVMNVTVKTNVAVETVYGKNKQEAASSAGVGNKISIAPDVQAILNITRRKGDAGSGGGGEDYEFDYNEPTLPPSLPNVRIIPFVAADALVKDKDGEVVSSSSVTGFPAHGIVPELRNDANFYDIVTQTSRFSPPAKTEGGFVPKDQAHFETVFHSSAADLNLEVSTGVTVAPEDIPVPPQPNPHRKTDVMSNKCLYEELEYTHGQFLPSRALCVRCICYFGQIICSSRKCPPLKIGCKRISDPNNKCCDNVVCADGVESPTVVLDRADSESSLQHEPTVSPDPFRDVIKTEPAPDLSSLIGEMQPPYLMESSLTTTTTTSSEATVADDDHQQQQQQSLSPPPLTSVDDFSRYNDSHDGNETDAEASAASVSITSKNFSADDVTLTTNDPIIKDGADDASETDNDSSIFSLDSVFNLFFDDDDRPAETWGEKKPATVANVTNSSSIVKVPTTTTASSVISSSSSSSYTTLSFPESTTTATTTTTTTATSTSTKPTSTSTSTTEVSLTTMGQSSNSSSESTTKTTTTTTSTTTTTKKPVTQADNDPLGLLKLAGCNIYGKMYRVNKIIAELSSECRECRCSEFGVQCKSLDC